MTLVHGGLLHLLMNMYALWIVGPLAEALYGRATYVVIYLLAALGGSIASYLFLENPAVGASGAIFGLFGLIFTATYFHKPALARQARALTSQIGILIVLNLVLGFGIGSFGGLGAIDNAAHVGGLLVGGWLGFVIAPRGAATLASFWQRAPGARGRCAQSVGGHAARRWCRAARRGPVHRPDDHAHVGMIQGRARTR